MYAVRDIELCTPFHITGGRFCAPTLVIPKFLRDAETFFRNGISLNSSRFSGPEDLLSSS